MVWFLYSSRSNKNRLLSEAVCEAWVVPNGYYSSSDMPSITSIADNAEDAVFGRILSNPRHVLQAYLDEWPQLCYSLRKRTGNKTLIEKTVDLNDRDFLIRNLYKYSYWLVFLSSIAIAYFLAFYCSFVFLLFYSLPIHVNVIKLRSTYNKRRWWWQWLHYNSSQVSCNPLMFQNFQFLTV